jgi:gamma-glutamylcyclotransferase (GGCT)/AIG2-like uncharacterized protein YtfP
VIQASAITDLLFVYGTLRRASHNQPATWLRQTADFVGEGTAAGRLYRVSWYPAFVSDPGSRDRVRGEVFRLHDPTKTLATLDDYEDIGDNLTGLYLRRVLPVTLTDGQTLNCQTYIYNQSITDLRLIESGDFYEQ